MFPASRRAHLRHVPAGTLQAVAETPDR